MNISPITLLAFCGCVTVASVISVIVVAVKEDGKTTVVQSNSGVAPPTAAEDFTIVVSSGSKFPTIKPPAKRNPCAGTKVDLPNVDCIVDAVANVGPQAGANVTKGYKGGMEVSQPPITTHYWLHEMCPVNVHWHLGTEHYSAGQYDETGTGPLAGSVLDDLDRRLAGDAKVRGGYQCKFYNEDDEKFNKPYVWEHCVGMEVGETYEVHWPHSAAGDCGTPNQYQSPFYDGVFCHAELLTNTAEQIGVQAQVFTIVNDEDYYFPDLMRGMIVDGDMGKDLAIYTGSTTGTSRNNEVCSQYSPITWQVDRTCHMISASTFDKMCADMKSQRDDMSDDLYAHGSRELVADELTADNQQNRNRVLRGN